MVVALVVTLAVEVPRQSDQSVDGRNTTGQLGRVARPLGVLPWSSDLGVDLRLGVRDGQRSFKSTVLIIRGGP
jgi:hypothetical protein